MLYEINNPSDPYTIEAESREVAFVACVLLGNGQYGFEPIGAPKEEEIPILIFMLSGPEEWCLQTFGMTVREIVNKYVNEDPSKLIACLESCVIGSPTERMTFMHGLALIDTEEKKQEWRQSWHDRRRSSMNDIGGRAKQIAENLKKNASTPIVPAPQQVFSV